MNKFLISVLIASSAVFIQAQTPQSSATQRSDQASIKNNSVTLPPLNGQQTVALKEVGELNATVIKLFQEKKYDEALSIAEKALQIGDANTLFDAGRALTVLTNLAEIYLVKKRQGDAIKLLERAVTVDEKLNVKNALLAQFFERLAYVYGLRNNLDKAEKTYLKALALRQEVHGAESAEVVETMTEVAAFYNYVNKPEKAEFFYQHAVEISDKIFKPDQAGYGAAFDHYQCWAYQNKGYKQGSEHIAEFAEKRSSTRSNGSLKQSQIQLVQEAGVINGKAKNLAQPPYPDEAKDIRASGVVLVRVLIDETGKVVQAKTTCGYDVFAREAERAALKSSFTPTLLSGQPVKVEGLIVYNFVAQ